MPASKIALELGLVPRFSWTAGDVRPPSSDGGVYEKTYVSMPLVRGADVELDEELLRLCSILSCKASFLSEIVEGGGKAEFYVSIFMSEGMGNFELDYEALREIIGLRLGVSVETYCPEAE
ncbi:MULTISPECIES: hypothetical protein [Stenotrophomonas]|uniref:hypothetical protein n=1 Tax=Stenotrophomonas TaxID=40323 RepID=UPI00131F456E|nr:MULTISPECIES: hypothetical protein [Stenotrophomonas]